MDYGFAVKRSLLIAAPLFLAACQTEPVPLQAVELGEIADDRYARAFVEDQVAVDRPIDLYQAMARAIKFNLDNRVEMMEQALRIEELELANYDMLPDLVASSDFSSRSNNPAATSIDVNGNQSLVASRSSDITVLSGDLTLSWDILDFGLSYVRAQQAGDEVMIALEQRRSTMNRIIEDVRTAYWRAITAQQLLGRLEVLQEEVEQAYRASQANSAGNGPTPLSVLRQRRELLTIARSLEELRRDLSVAKLQLAALMNLKPGTDYTLAAPIREQAPLVFTADPQKLIRTALINRPEMREITYRLRINEKENDIAILEALPSLKGFFGAEASTNSLLVNQNWLSYGAQASWNLINLVRLPQRKAAIAAGNDLLDARSLALTQAVATQVMVAYSRFELLNNELTTAARIDSVNRDIAEQVKKRAQAGAESDLNRIREELNEILAELRFDLTYAELQNAYGNIFSAVGVDLFDAQLNGDETLEEMETALRGLWTKRTLKD